MKRLVLCYDGTSNNQNSRNPPTNVARISRLICRIDRFGVRQRVHYVRGMGSGLGLFAKVSNKIQQALGNEIGKHIVEGLRFLSHSYTPGDEIILIGFSRGAFTARCLAQLINDFGLVASHDKHTTMSQIYRRWVEYHRKGRPFPNSSQASVYNNVPVEACAVWDTVAEIRDVRPWKDNRMAFVGEEVTPNIKHAIQALAIDEQRVHFAPEIWKSYDSATQTLDQSWFRGTHCDVGGGNAHETDNNFANISLVWMVSTLATRTDLKFNFHFKYNLLDLKTVLTDPKYTRANKEVMSKEILPDSRTSFWTWLAKHDPKHHSWPLIRCPGNDGRQSIHWSVQPENSPKLFSHRCPELDAGAMQPGSYQGHSWWTNFESGIHIPEEIPTQLEIDILDQVGFTGIAAKLRTILLDKIEVDAHMPQAMHQAIEPAAESVEQKNSLNHYEDRGYSSPGAENFETYNERIRENQKLPNYGHMNETYASSGHDRADHDNASFFDYGSSRDAQYGSGNTDADQSGRSHGLQQRRDRRGAYAIKPETRHPRRIEEFIMDDDRGSFRFYRYSIPSKEARGRSQFSTQIYDRWVEVPEARRYKWVQHGHRPEDPAKIYWSRLIAS